MRIVVASCSAIYTGRGDTKLGKAVRAIMFKGDGCISIHNDKSNKPLNYMGKGNTFTEIIEDDVVVWYFDTRKESLRIDMHEIFSDTSFEIDEEDPGLVRDGTEDHLQAWLADHPEALGPGFKTIQREYQTGDGPVDLLVEDADGIPVAVEVKRVAMIGAADQASRYRAALVEQEGFENVRAMVAALDVRPNTEKLATKRNIECITLPENWRDNAVVIHQEEIE
jgi:RecB family endonuclease NucS